MDFEHAVGVGLANDVDSAGVDAGVDSGACELEGKEEMLDLFIPYPQAARSDSLVSVIRSPLMGETRPAGRRPNVPEGLRLHDQP